ncbi:hypothetical protein NW752_000210 [Fusarium irregulare]|uniref:2EXR domain-containing protein n=1 Tax=Fusarium irregulare TaxID=2494466 RepID=A0A9W8Q1F1_9HYPO|nr:hypothetical protein NW766_001626 [Fusarium irregulare]KAJ4027959.1 hypothetical protein NW752_000210 [Fusarium irregulare]
MDNTPPRRNVGTQTLSPPCPNKRIKSLERVDSPLRQASASEQRADVSQEQDDELGSFHRFTQLPPELQDQIWEHALDISIPTAHYVDVELKRDGCWKMRLLRIKRECNGCNSSKDRPSIGAIYPVRQALMQTCRRSYAFVKDASKLWDRDRPGTALLENGESYREIVRMDRVGSPLPPKQPTKRIDTSQDLMILHYTVYNVFGKRGMYSHFKRGTGTNVKQVAVHWDTSFFWRLESSLACMLGVLNELRTLYILWHPRQDWIPPPNFIDEIPEEHRWKEYLHRHRRTPEDTSPETFHLRDRIYYELPDDMVMLITTQNGVAGSCRTVEEIAKRQRQKNGGVPLPPLVIRFMSWKLAPGVRGRFETDPELL